jgi:hypothetical protein
MMWLIPCGLCEVKLTLSQELILLKTFDYRIIFYSCTKKKKELISTLNFMSKSHNNQLSLFLLT